MIANEPRRSFEFFKSPVQAGVAAREYPYSTVQIFSLYFFRAIVISIKTYFLLSFAPEQVDLQESADPEIEEILAQVEVLWAFYLNNPILMTVVEFSISILMTTIFWQISRAITGHELSWQQSQSAMIRFLLVSALIGVILGLCQLLFGGLFGLVSFFAGLYLFFITILVFQGANNLGGFFSSFFVFVLSVMAIIGLLSVLAFFGAVLFA